MIVRLKEWLVGRPQYGIDSVFLSESITNIIARKVSIIKLTDTIITSY
ncbi:MAG: hypothetical protein GXO97_08735 [Nitrospirae bacterium]|nr:hypothetical protein [Nitrospirota bacterium]